MRVRAKCGIPMTPCQWPGARLPLGRRRNAGRFPAFRCWLSRGTCLVVVGDGPCREELQQLAVELGVAQDVTFLGTRSDVPRILTAFDIVALTSTTETLPLSLLEGMAASRPVVATDVGDVARIVVDGETGYVVPSEDVMLFADRLGRLASDAELRAEMGRRSRQRVEGTYGSSLMTQAYEQLFDEILREHDVLKHT